MNRLSTERRGQVIACLVEGMSIRATCRVVGVARNTVNKLLRDLGVACSEYQDRTLRNLSCRRFECDEIWSFVGAKEAHVMEHHPDDYGDVWTWTAIDAETKLVPSWLVGERTARDCYTFLYDLRSRLQPGRIQITTDGLASYLQVIEPLFGSDRVDFAQLVKMYEGTGDERRYSPARCTGIDKRTVTGKPDPRYISTSYVERQNLSMRMGMRRFTRLTNAFSKKVENHAHAVSLHFMHYNFARPHQTLSKKAGRPTTPAMAAGAADHVWSVWEIAGLLESK
ncbi:MAG: IS1 family transposase [Acidimicrobiales bacterium]